MSTNLALARIHSSIGTSSRSIGSRFADFVVVTDFAGVDPTGVADSTAGIQAAFNSSPAVFFPYGTYNVSGTITLPPNAFVVGQGNIPGFQAGLVPTKFSMIVGTTSAFVFSLSSVLSVGHGTVTGPHFYDVCLYCQNGVKLNDPANGAPGVGGTQGDIEGCIFSNTSIIQNGTPGTGTGIQISVPSHFRMDHNTEVLGFNVNVDIYYNDTPAQIKNCRLWQFGTAAIQATALGPSGSMIRIEGNDLLDGLAGAKSFIRGNNDQFIIRDNFFEQGPPEASGMIAAIEILDGNIMLIIEGNVFGLAPPYCANWLNVTSTTNPKLCRISNNLFEDSGPALFNGGAGLPVFSGLGHELVVCTHAGNNQYSTAFGDEHGIPFNTVYSIPLPDGVVSVITPNLQGGISNRDYGGSAFIVNEDLLITSPVAGFNTVYFQDPNIVVKGTVGVKVLAYASAPLTLYFALFDAADAFSVGAPVLTGTISLTTQPTWFPLTASTSIPTTRLIVSLSNFQGAGTAMIKSIVTRV